MAIEWKQEAPADLSTGEREAWMAQTGKWQIWVALHGLRKGDVDHTWWTWGVTELGDDGDDPMTEGTVYVGHTAETNQTSFTLAKELAEIVAGVLRRAEPPLRLYTGVCEVCGSEDTLNVSGLPCERCGAALKLRDDTPRAQEVEQ